MTIDDHSETRSIEGEIAVITGGGTGIGRGIALALARAKIAVVICGRRPKPIEDTAMEIVAAGGEALALPADVSDEDDVERLVARTLQKYGKVDLLINNAGIGGSGSIHDHDIHTWDRVIAVNLRGPFLMARAILPHMRAQRSGHIINISSEAGLEFYPGNGAYGVAKHALNALSEYVQDEVAGVLVVDQRVDRQRAGRSGSHEVSAAGRYRRSGALAGEPTPQRQDRKANFDPDHAEPVGVMRSTHRRARTPTRRQSRRPCDPI